jgi:glucokinase
MPAQTHCPQSPQNAVIALDLGGTKLAAGVFSASAKPCWRRVLPLCDRRGAAVGRLIVGEVRRLQCAARQRRWRVRAVGISVPGIAHAANGRVWAPNIHGWTDYPLRDEITAAVNDPSVRVVVDSDRAASILGEAWQGAARGCHNAVFLAVGTGIGAGILVEGRVVRGANDIAGAIGWWALSQPFHPAYEACGDFEYHASGNGLAQRAAALVARMPDYRGRLRRKRELTARDVFTAYDAGDSVAERVIHDAVEYWGRASANLVSLLNPERIIFGGGVFGPATRFLKDIKREAGQWAQPISVRRVKFLTSELGPTAALYGAGRLALQNIDLAGLP